VILKNIWWNLRIQNIWWNLRIQSLCSYLLKCVLKKTFKILASKNISSVLLLYSLIVSYPAETQKGTTSKSLAIRILRDKKIDSVYLKAKGLISKGFTAGSGYSEIWIRDFNTFINASLDVSSPEEVKGKLFLFFKFQAFDGNIVDGVIQKTKVTSEGYQYRYSKLATNWAAHKNTVETDQETSLIQAVKKYVDRAKDHAFH
jgi:hypothetical protein